MVPCAPLRQFKNSMLQRKLSVYIGLSNQQMFKISECFYKIHQISHHKIRTENVLSICSALKAFTPFVYLHQCFVFNMEIKKGLICKIVHNFQEKSERSIWTYRLPIDFSINLLAFYHECCDLIIELLISPPANGEPLLNNKLISHTTATLACLSHSSFFPIAGFMYDMLNSYHTAFYICGATTTLSSCLMFLIPWLMPNQQGGVFRRDSCQSRLEGLLNSQSSTPCTRKHSRSFFAGRSVKSRSLDSGNSSLSSPVTGEISLCEADRAEQEYLTGFTIDNEADVATDGASNEKSSFSMDTSINTVFNASMSHRGSITKFLLQQQLQSQSRASTPLSGSRRGSSQSPMGLQSGGSSSRSSMSSSLGFRTSSSSPSRGKGSFKRSLSESRQGSFEVSEESSSEESFEPISSEPEGEMDTLSLGQLFNEDTRRESGESTVVGSNWESGRSTVIAGTPKVFQSGMKDDDMLHLLAARLLQAMRGRKQDDCGEERESTV